MSKISNKPRIVFSGHTSAGKTTMIRTLIKRPIGEISFDANETKTTTEDYYDVLQAIFIDSPGFNQAGQLSKSIEKGDDPSEDIDLKYDILAMEALKSPDAVLYIIDVDDKTDIGRAKEASLIRSVNKNIVVVLNKIGEGDISKQNKEKSWRAFLLENDIDQIVSFDAHFDKPSKVHEIYNALYNVLPKEKANFFKIGIKEFEKRQKQIRSKAFNYLYELIDDLRCHSIELKGEDYSYDEKEVKIAIQESLGEYVNKASMEFTQKVSYLYEFAAANPQKTSDEVEDALVVSRTNILQLLKGTSSVSGISSGIFATIGYAFGFIVTGSLSGGMAATAGGVLGAQWGSSIGGILGVLTGAAMSSGNRHTGSFTSEQIEITANQGIAIIWGLSNHGYGKSDEISSEQLGCWGEYAADLGDIELSESWNTASKSQINMYFREAMKTLEKKY